MSHSPIAWLLILPNGAWLSLPAGLWLIVRGVYEHWKQTDSQYPEWAPLVRAAMVILGTITLAIGTIVTYYGFMTSIDTVYARPVPVVPEWVFWIGVADLVMLGAIVAVAGAFRDSRFFRGLIYLVAVGATLATAGLLTFRNNAWGFVLGITWLLTVIAVGAALAWDWWKRSGVIWVSGSH